MKTFKKVDNDNNSKNIIDKISFSYEESENQDNLFTSNHIKYDVSITYKERTFTTTYQTAQEVKKDDAIWCIFSDMECYDSTQDLETFASAFYTNDAKVKEIITTFKACKDTSNILHKIFTNEEIEEVKKELEERGY